MWTTTLMLLTVFVDALIVSAWSAWFPEPAEPQSRKPADEPSR